MEKYVFLHMQRFQILSGSALKLIAVVSMICDHVAKFWLLPAGLIGRNAYMVMSAGMGRIAFPLFAFLLVEGFLHTRNVRKYALNLGVFALLTTIPWNLVHGSILYHERLNVLFTLLLGLMAIWGLGRLKGWKTFLCVTLSLFLAYVLRTEYGIMGLITIVLLYALRGHREYQALSVFGCLFKGKTTSGLLLAMPLILMYNGERGFIRGRVWKYVFYSIYPLHLLLIYLASLV